jgi:16S rRNA (guanine527-N7)-methyltransferase
MSNADPIPLAATRREAGSPADALDRFGTVTDRTKRDLERYVALLAEWQRVHNLVARGALDAVWTRHVADSLQILDYAPDFSEWVDLGSGAGFPGLVVAIASKESSGRHFTLVESNAKKVAFLRAAIRESGANATVAAERIEAHAPKMSGRADVISARALAPLPMLLKLAAPYAHAGSVMLFLKGREYVQELDAASQSWAFDVVDYVSATDSGGRVLAIRNLRPKAQLP